MKTKITKNQAQEIQHKIGILCDSPDLQDDYNLSQAQADELYNTIPLSGGEWIIPDCFIEVVKEELSDHANVLRGIADSARSGGKIGQALENSRLANQLENLVE